MRSRCAPWATSRTRTCRRWSSGFVAAPPRAPRPPQGPAGPVLVEHDAPQRGLRRAGRGAPARARATNTVNAAGPALTRISIASHSWPLPVRDGGGDPATRTYAAGGVLSAEGLEGSNGRRSGGFRVGMPRHRGRPPCPAGPTVSDPARLAAHPAPSTVAAMGTWMRVRPWLFSVLLSALAMLLVGRSARTRPSCWGGARDLGPRGQGTGLGCGHRRPAVAHRPSRRHAPPAFIVPSALCSRQAIRSDRPSRAS